MYRITVTKKGYVKGVYFNANPEIGAWIAKTDHPRCKVVVEKRNEFGECVEVEVVA